MGDVILSKILIRIVVVGITELLILLIIAHPIVNA